MSIVPVSKLALGLALPTRWNPNNFPSHRVRVNFNSNNFPGCSLWMGTRLHGSEIIIFGTAAGILYLGFYLQAYASDPWTCFVFVFVFFSSFFLSHIIINYPLFNSGYSEYRRLHLYCRFLLLKIYLGKFVISV